MFITLGLALLVAAASRPGAAQGLDGMLMDMARLKEGIRSNRVSSYNRDGANRDRLENIGEGERRTLFDIEGAGVITHIWITIAPPRIQRNDIILRMYWDGEEHPSVETPLSPFFGQRWNEYYSFRSLPLAVGPRDGRLLVSYFPMPFADDARIEIENQTGQPIDAFYYYVDYQEMDELPSDMGRSHAWYNHELAEAMEGSELAAADPIEGLSHNLRAEHNPRGEGDGNYLIANIEGHGHFLRVNYYVHSPTPVWYGEGDDMFFIDGDEWPPELHGTGTEDYFNTAWVPRLNTSTRSSAWPASMTTSAGWGAPTSTVST